MRFWKVGELAKETGLTVRTLHHYDEIGLLSPARRTPAGHRLYDAADIARLQQIVSLRQLGFSLDQVAELLDRPGASSLGVVRMHLARLREDIERQQRLYARLQALEAGLQSAEGVSVEDLIHTIEVMTMYEKYYTPEQLEELRERGRAVGEDRIREVEAEWPELIRQVRAEVDRGSDPASEPVQRLARRWSELVREFTGGNPGIEESLGNLWRNEGPALARQYGEAVPDREMFEYIGRAMRAGK